MIDDANMVERGVSVSALREKLSFDPETGLFLWKERGRNLIASDAARNGWNSRWAGRAALTVAFNGYRQGSIDNKHFFAHRVAWALHYGVWPDGQIDHINGDRSDNRIVNLRVVDNTENAKNAKLFRTNTSGVTGVYWYPRKNRWRVKITIDRKARYCGLFLKFEDAVAARKAAEKKFGFHVNHGRESPVRAGHHYGKDEG